MPCCGLSVCIHASKEYTFELHLTNVNIAIGVRSHKRQRSSMLRPLSLAATAILNIVAFTVAAIFSSAVTRAESAVLLEPSTCGRWEDITLTNATQWNPPTIARSIELVAVIHQNIITSSRFHLACNDQYSGASNCNPYTGQALNVTMSESSCPFDPSICQSESTGIMLDTGRVNTLKHLGINSRKKDSVDFRKTVSCAPLVTDGHVTSGISAITSSDDTQKVSNLTAYFYGENRRVGSNFTYAFNPETFQTSAGTGVDINSYQLK